MDKSPEYEVVNNPPDDMTPYLKDGWKLYGPVHTCNQTGKPFRVLRRG